ncbi:hypothetical protein [Flavobacterium sp. LS1R10]|uniref:hypothetical protein n=1 Tax=Flavobacterium sp. LS1R10 TaxID=2497482 RepID=UPI000F849CF5|nr:hypothetical protein [Flavobacterium sp. LS1R10]RTY72573.1 hypothetical protein EKL96_14085 [Flavobacterium sp. LS1R10]
MTLNVIKIQIESQKRWNSNYIKHNAIRLCKQAIGSGELNRFQIKEVKNLLLKFEAIDDPWCSSGIAKSKEVLAVVKLFVELEGIIE